MSLLYSLMFKEYIRVNIFTA